MYLLAQLWLYLLLAGALGLIVGALVFRSCTRSRWLELEADRNEALETQAILADRLASAGDVTTQQEQWRSKVLALEGALAAAHGKIAQQSTESDQLRALVDRHTLEANRMRAELAGFQAEVDKAQAEWQGELARLEGELGRAKSQPAQGSAQTAGQAAEVARLRARSEALAGEVERLRAELEDNRSAVAAARKASEQELSTVRGQLATVQALEEAARSAEQWQSTARSLEADLTALKREYGQNTVERTDEATRLRLEAQVLRSQLDAAQAESAAGKRALEAKVSALQGELAAREHSAAGTPGPEHWRTTALQLDADLTLARQQIEELSAEVARLSSAASAVSAFTEWARRDAPSTGAPGVNDWDAELSEVESVVAALEAKADSESTTLAPAVDRGISAAASMSPDELERAVAAAGEGVPPRGLADQPDDLKQIGGVGPQNEAWLHARGIFRFAQIARWTPAEVAWVARHLPTLGARVYRENWVDQAARLARGEMTEAKAKYLRGEHT